MGGVYTAQRILAGPCFLFSSDARYGLARGSEGVSEPLWSRSVWQRQNRRGHTGLTGLEYPAGAGFFRFSTAFIF
ncbi:MAG: hypothetical protein CBC13_10515 [Planctomycetia bacterium TMED53]|nr:MAG: hypothetical protein CBC13_10515 [Planctomycetia bacterium TMED53]